MKTTKIQCYSIAGSGHAIPLLRVIEIIQQKNPTFQITFYSSQYYIERITKGYPQIKMVGIEDGLNEQVQKELKKKYAYRFMKECFFKNFKDYFQKKQDRPDLIIGDIFTAQAFSFARKNKIKYIINSVLSYGCLQNLFHLPTFRRSFGIGGFTITYPLPFNPAHIIGFSYLHDSFRYSNRLLINSAIGLEHATVLPTHHTMTGLLSNRGGKKGTIDIDLKEFMAHWIKQGKTKFLYISFGSMLKLSEKFTLTLLKAIQTVEYPTIWSLRNDLKGNVTSKYIYHRKWLPQQSILGLPEVRGYISHCGWGSIAQAVISETPMLCIPGFGDQKYNAKLIHDKQIGIQIYETRLRGPPEEFDPNIKVEAIVEGVAKLMENDSYLSNISKVSAICKTYRTDEIINDAVIHTLEFGNEHLIDKEYQKATSRSTFTTLKLLFLILLIVGVWTYRERLL